MKKILSSLVFVAASYMGYSQCTVIAAPWSDGFESFSLGAVPANSNCWESPTTSQPDWTIRNAPTTSGNTGPQAAFEGNNYAYLETSTGAGTDYFESPEISLVGFPSPTLTFHYHMFGAAMGTLSVEVWDGATWSAPIWSLSGEQHTSMGDPWTPATVSLAAYTDTIKVRFVGLRGGSFTSDMAIDAVGVCTPTFSTINVESCGYYTSPSGKQFHDSGTYMDTIVNSTFCDSIITINVTTNNTFATVNVTSCTWTSPSGNVWGQSGTYLDTIPNAAGCDSVITTNYTTQNTTSTFPTSACNSYTAPSGQVYTVPGTYNDTIANAAGCDSIMTIGLTINYDDNLAIFVTTCGNAYTSDAGNIYTLTGLYFENYSTVFGCDSVVSIDLTVAEGNAQTIPVSACDSFMSDAGITYYTTGSYLEEYVGITGCDSTITYDVTINTVDPSISQGANGAPSTILTANSNGATYQWVDCNNGFAIFPDSTNQSFTAAVNGDYACIVTENGCTDTSDCIRVQTVSVDEIANSFNLYPNPSTGAFTVELDNLAGKTLIEVSNAAGKIVYSEYANASKSNIDLENIANGIYVVTISNATAKAQRTIVIE